EHVEAGIQIEYVLQQGGYHRHADEADHHGRQTFDQLDHRLEDAAHSRRGNLRQIEGGAHAQGYGNQGRDHHDADAADDHREDAVIRRIIGGIPGRTEEEVLDRDLLEDRQAFHDQEYQDEAENDDAGGAHHQKEQMHQQIHRAAADQRLFLGLKGDR